MTDERIVDYFHKGYKELVWQELLLKASDIPEIQICFDKERGFGISLDDQVVYFETFSSNPIFLKRILLELKKFKKE